MGWASACQAGLPDPTKPPETAQTGGAMVLSAIMISAQNRLAVINGTIVHVGDEFSGMKVQAIESNRVVMEGPQGKTNLVLLTNPRKEVK